MKLYLVRHGIAIDREDPNAPPEANRFLTEEGIQKTKKVARGFAELKIKPDVIMSSPYLRAIQTAEIFCEAMGIKDYKIQHSKALLPDAPPQALFGEISGFVSSKVLAFGHAPHVDRLISFALSSQAEISALKKAGVVGFDIRSTDPPRSTLEFYLTPQIMKLMAKK